MQIAHGPFGPLHDAVMMVDDALGQAFQYLGVGQLIPVRRLDFHVVSVATIKLVISELCARDLGEHAVRQESIHAFGNEKPAARASHPDIRGVDDVHALELRSDQRSMMAGIDNDKSHGDIALAPAIADEVDK